MLVEVLGEKRAWSKGNQVLAEEEVLGLLIMAAVGRLQAIMVMVSLLVVLSSIRVRQHQAVPAGFNAAVVSQPRLQLRVHS